MKTVADVNVLFALLVQSHTHHGCAWNWWSSCPMDTLALCQLTRMGILRLLTNSKAMNGQPLSTLDALAVWDALMADPRCFWTESNSAHEAIFRRYVTGRVPSPNLWSDAWLAAHAESHAWRLTSFDSDFRSFGLTDFELLKP